MSVTTDLFDSIRNDIRAINTEPWTIPTDVLVVLAALHHHDQGLYQHALRVARISWDLSFLTLLKPIEREHLLLAALLHDCGKLLTPLRVLHSSSFNHYEAQILRRHVQDASLILASYPALQPALPIILQHHEQPDGGGYFGIRHCLPASRVLALANSLDHLLTKPITHTMMRQILRRGAGRLWDAVLVHNVVSSWHFTPSGFLENDFVLNMEHA